MPNPLRHGVDRAAVFSTVVRQHRRRLGLTQEELAEAAGIAARSLRSIETARTSLPRLSTVRLLADALALTGAERDAFCAVAQKGATHDADSTGDVPPVPAQLPPDIPTFSGREEQLKLLTALLDAGVARSGSVVIATIVGTAGVGKTALAVRWAHQMRARFPDGQFYVDLRGFAPSGTVVAPVDALRGLLEALGTPGHALPRSLADQSALYRSIMAHRQMLVVLDNARDADHVRLLLPGSSRSTVLVTSRDELTGLVIAEGAHPIVLDLLPAPDGQDLLARRIGAERVAREPDAVAEIVEACARLPLALSIVAARIAVRPHQSVADVASDLRDQEARLAAFSGACSRTDVRAVFSWSYQALQPDAARLFRSLGLHAGPDISAAAAASLMGRPVEPTGRLLEELVGANMLVEHARGRYTFHDLLRAYAMEQSVTDPVEVRAQASLRILDHYVQSASAAAMVRYPDQPSIVLPPVRSGVIPEQPSDHRAASAWLRQEQLVLAAAVHAATDTLSAPFAWRLAWALEDFLVSEGNAHQLLAVQTAALAAASRVPEPHGNAVALSGLGRAHSLLWNHKAAERHFRSALALNQDLADVRAEAHNRLHLAAAISGRPDHVGDALNHCLEALRLFRSSSDEWGEALAFTGLAGAYSLQGDLQSSAEYGRRARVFFRDAGSQPGEALATGLLAWTYWRLRRRRVALAYYRQHVALRRAAGQPLLEAEALCRLAYVSHHIGDDAAAWEAYRRALVILGEPMHPLAGYVRDQLAAISVCRSTGRRFIVKRTLNASPHPSRRSRPPVVQQDLNNEGLVPG